MMKKEVSTREISGGTHLNQGENDHNTLGPHSEAQTMAHVDIFNFKI